MAVLMPTTRWSAKYIVPGAPREFSLSQNERGNERKPCPREDALAALPVEIFDRTTALQAETDESTTMMSYMSGGFPIKRVRFRSTRKRDRSMILSA